MSVQSIYTYDQALTAGLAYWTLDVSNWGNRQTGADSTSTTVTTSSQAGAALIVLGPDDTSGGAIVDYNTIGSGVAFLVPNPGALQSRSLTISPGCPGMMFPGPIQLRVNSLVQFGDTYFRDGTAAVQNFGGAEALFEAPRLQALVFPKQPTIPIPTRRSPLHRFVEAAAAGDNVDTLLRIWPVQGRNRKKVEFRATGTVTANVRVGLINYFVVTSLGVPFPFGTEDNIAAAAPVDANTGVQASFESTRPAQWMAAYYSRTGGAGTIGAVAVAED